MLIFFFLCLMRNFMKLFFSCIYNLFTAILIDNSIQIGMIVNLRNVFHHFLHRLLTIRLFVCVIQE